MLHFEKTAHGARHRAEVPSIWMKSTSGAAGYQINFFGGKMKKLLGWGMILYGFYLVFLGNGYITSNDKLYGLMLLLSGFCLAFDPGEKRTSPVSAPTAGHTPPVSNTRGEILSVGLSDGCPYSAYLGRLEQITYLVAAEFPYREIPIYVGVRKLDNAFCAVYFGFEDLPGTHSPYFGDDFTVANGGASFMTEKATAFTTPEKVRKEIELQFNWPDLPARITESTVYDHGQMASNPLVSYRFVIGPMKRL